MVSIKMIVVFVALVNATSLENNGAEEVLSRSRRDLIGYNRQQNNVISHLRKRLSKDSSYLKQIQQFYANKKKSVNFQKTNVRRNRFRQHHRL